MDFITSPGLYVYRTLRRKLELSLIEQFYKRAFMKHACIDGCGREAMVARMPGGKSNWWIHRRCWPCNLRFHASYRPALTPADLAAEALCGFWAA